MSVSTSYTYKGKVKDPRYMQNKKDSRISLVFAPNPGMYFDFFYYFVKSCFAIDNFGNRCAPRTDEPPSGITMAAFMQLGSNINVIAPNPGMYYDFFFYCFVMFSY